MSPTIQKRVMTGAIVFLALFMFAIPRSVSAQAGKANDGQKLYEENCAKCHAPDGSGNTTIGKAVGAKDLRAPEALKLTDAQIATQIEQGKGNMPPFSNLTKAQIDALVPYLRGLAKKQAASKKTQ
jgi:mono/diheme cytochrome c family protein